MKRWILLVFLSLSGPWVMAEEPFEDYSFICRTSPTATSELILDGSVDPSGSFAISIRAKGVFKEWNGAFFMARRYPAKSYTSYRSITPDFPKTMVRIFWGNEETMSPFKGFVKSKDLNGGVSVEFSCEVQ